jgi:hypothetical protein
MNTDQAGAAALTSILMLLFHIKQTKTPWPESVIELYRPSDRRLLAKLVPAFTDRGRHVVSVTVFYQVLSSHALLVSPSERQGQTVVVFGFVLISQMLLPQADALEGSQSDVKF